MPSGPTTGHRLGRSSAWVAFAITLVGACSSSDGNSPTTDAGPTHSDGATSGDGGATSGDGGKKSDGSGGTSDGGGSTGKCETDDLFGSSGGFPPDFTPGSPGFNYYITRKNGANGEGCVCEETNPFAAKDSAALPAPGDPCPDPLLGGGGCAMVCCGGCARAGTGFGIALCKSDICVGGDEACTFIKEFSEKLDEPLRLCAD